MSHLSFHEITPDDQTARESSLSRRQLLRGAATGIAIAAGSKLALAQNQPKITPPGAPAIGDEPVVATAQPMPKLSDPAPLAPSQRVGFAVVGLGDLTLNQILPSIADCKQAKLTALVSGDAAKANRVAQQYGLAPGSVYNYDNFDSIRNNPAVQVVYVITPNSLHRPFVERAARAGKNVMCEKPFATNSADCVAMINACKAANVKLMVAYRAQYEPYNLEAIRVCRSGELGKMVAISSDHGRPIDPTKPADQWRLDKQMAGGGPLPDIGIYSLNACRYLTGEEPTEISAMLYQPTDNPKFKEVEQSVVWTMRFPGGVLTNCSTAYDYQDTKRFRVFFEKGWLELDPATDYYRHNMKISHPVPKRGEQTDDVVEFESVTEEVPITPKNQFALEIDHMAECVLQNKMPKTPGEEGLRDIQLIETIYRAAREGRTIKV